MQTLKIDPQLHDKQKVAMSLLLDHQNGITEILYGGAAGGGKCVHEDTHIYLSNGKSKMIKDIVVGDDVLSVDGKYNVVASKVTGKVDVGMKDGLLFRVFGGDSVTVSKDHPFLVYNNGNPKWVVADKLSPGDCVAVPQKEPSGTRCDYSTNMYEFFGYLIGNGSLTTGLTISMADNGALERFGGLVPDGYVLTNGGSLTYGIRCFKRTPKGYVINPLYNEIKQLGLNTKSKHKAIPESFMDISEENIYALLSGIIATDGYVTKRGVGITLASKQLIYDIRRLLLRVGINSNIRSRVVKLKDQRFFAWEIKITRNENLKKISENCNLAHKHERIVLGKTNLMGVNYEYTIGDIRFRRVKSIEPVGGVAMYDIETTHGNFIGNNIVLHNSFLGSMWLILGCLMYPETRWVMGRAVLKNIKETTLNSFFDVCRMWKLKDGVHWTFNSKDNIIKFTKDYGGSEIILKDLALYPSDPEFDGLGSLEITGAFVDEVSQINTKAKDILKSRIRYRLTDFCGVCGAGDIRQVKFKAEDGENLFFCDKCKNHTKGLIPKILFATNPTKNWAYMDFYKPAVENRIEPYRMYVPSLPGDNRFLPDEYINTLGKLPDGDKQRLLFGNWEYEDNIATMIPYEKIIGAFTIPVSGGRKFISADIARLGRDKTVIGVWDGLILVRIETMEKNKTREAVDMIKRLRFEYKVAWENICIDADGIGAGVVDYLPDEVVSIVNNSMPIRVDGEKENFGNLKSQLYFYLAKYINEGKVFIRATPTIREMITSELELVRRKNVDQDGKFWVLPKQDVKDMLGRSPDFSDMMAYRMIFEITNKSRFL